MKPSRLSNFLPLHNRTSIISVILSSQPSTRRKLHNTASSIPSTLQYLESFRRIIESLSNNPRNYKALTALDSLLAQHHFFTPAISVIVIDFLSQVKKLQRVKAVVLNLKRQCKVSDYFLYGLVFDFLARDGDFDAVETVWAEICGSEVRIGASEYIKHVCKYGSVDEIRRVCEKALMGGSGRVVLERQSLVSLVGALCKVNECSLAKELAIEMLDRGYAVDDLSYFVIFQCFCRNGNVDEADLILRILRKSKSHFDVCIYGSFLHALCKSGKLREANKLFCKLIKRDSLETSTKKAGTLKEGRRAVFQMSCEGAIPEIIAYEAYFRSLCSTGRINEAENLLKDMIKKRNVLAICVYGSFIKALFRVGRAEDAFKFFNSESKKGMVRREEMARYVIVGLCENGRLNEALEILKTISSCATGARTLNCILDGYWKEGRVVEAERLFQRLQGGGLGSYEVSTYSIMINGYCNEGNVSMAVSLVEEMLSRKMLVNETLYGVIIRGLCGCGRVEEALIYFNTTIENGHAVSGKRWRQLLHPFLIQQPLPEDAF